GRFEALESSGGTVGFVGVEGNGVVAAFCVSDTPRMESCEAVGKLRGALGLRVKMLTGDGVGAAQAVAEAVGLPQGDIHAGLLPEDKLGGSGLVGWLRGEQQEVLGGRARKGGVVLMSGDGVNDAPALAKANVGVAIGVASAAVRGGG
ncbi:unnamed protein product, partial [Discosporangium mesarthrocarpum]